MALSFGKVSGALAAVHNENTAALINLNADFTLVKLEAPAEYSALGNTISKKRKVDAEEGTLHKTARRLGALFKDALPITEELSRAYGTRVSEICTMLPVISSRENDGIFGSHLGLDTTSIWAAATSGSAAIQTHLLACMLARIFPGQEAISLWVELVEKRKAWIRVKHGNALYSSDHQNEIIASQQHISRSDLATWDSSARAWLQSADQAKKRQHIQTTLILDNASVPVNNEPQTYNSVMKAWTTALEAMNDLVKGISQRVQDGATLLAVSSWHLYPDMVVHGDKYAEEVRQEDHLFNEGTFLTLGLQQVREDMKSVYWSLPLACLQFYGHPVRTERTMGEDNKRITCEQFGYVILGCLFAGWANFATNDEDGLRMLGKLTGLMDLPRYSRFDHANAPPWLMYLENAAQNYVDCEDDERKVAQKLVKLGRRWSTFLFHDSWQSPVFGLSSLSGILGVLKDELHKLNCLRSFFADSGNYVGTDLILQMERSKGMTEYATMEPCRVQASSKRTLDGSFKKSDTKHFRWVLVSQYQLSLFVQRCDDFRNLDAAIEKTTRLRSNSVSADSALKPLLNEDFNSIKEMEELREVIVYAQRQRYIESIGEVYVPVIRRDQIRHNFIIEFKATNNESEASSYDSEASSNDSETNSNDSETNSNKSEGGLCFPQSEDFIDAARELLAAFSPISGARSTLTHKPMIPNGEISPLWGLYYTGSTGSSSSPYIRSSSTLYLRPILMDYLFQPENIDRKLLRNYIRSIAFTQSLIKNLRACAMMSELYHLLPGAEISVTVLKTPLATAKWANDSMGKDGLNLSRAFACIAMFDSGTCNINPDSLSQVFALSSGNSLYISATLLCDPIEKTGQAEIRRVVGNVGKPGMTFLISPPEVKSREADPGQYMAINHTRFDGEPGSHFGNTSLHLSFTNYEIPLVADEGHQHLIDRVLVLVETLISVYVGQTWVGEVDILKTFKDDIPRVDEHIQGCSAIERMVSYEEIVKQFPSLEATSIENWDELIEAPSSGTIVVKAQKNWLARLAATAMAVNYGFTPVILHEDVCWSCCSRAFYMGIDKHVLIW